MNAKRLKNNHYLSILTAVLIFIMSVTVPVSAFAAESEAPAGSTESTAEAAVAEPFRYEHDPMENPDAVVDIVVNPDAVYGYSPNPDSVRLGKYADALDWTDPDQVAAARQERAEYHESINGLYRLIEDMLGEGKNVEEIARAVSKERNEIRLAAYNGDPDGLAIVRKSNLDTYGQEEGPTPDQLYEEYGSWQTVIEKALSSNPGMDACLGFYDEYYDTYDISDRLSALQDAEEHETAEAEASEEPAAEASEEPAADASEEPAADAGSSKTYTVKKGDCLWNIAASELGDGSRWTEIYELNKSEIRNPRLIYAGQEFVLPAA